MNSLFKKYREKPFFWLVQFLVLVFVSYSFSQTPLLICLPGKSNPQTLQSGFDNLLGAGKTIAFGKIKDLEATIGTSPNASIIVPEPYITCVEGFKIIMAGKKKNSGGEKYLIISASKDITKDNIADKKVGIIDFLGRERLLAFVKDQFNVDIKLLKRVNKDDDLLTMLGMEAVDAIIVSSSQYKEILSNTKLPLTVVMESSKITGYPVCAVKKGVVYEDLKAALLKGSSSLLKELGIDSWEVR